MIISQDFFFIKMKIYVLRVVRTMIYKRLGLLESQHFLSIRARYNIEDVSAYYFCLVPIYNEAE
jgi:hypothetical protein